MNKHVQGEGACGKAFGQKLVVNTIMWKCVVGSTKKNKNKNVDADRKILENKRGTPFILFHILDDILLQFI